MGEAVASHGLLDAAAVSRVSIEERRDGGEEDDRLLVVVRRVHKSLTSEVEIEMILQLPCAA